MTLLSSGSSNYRTLRTQSQKDSDNTMHLYNQQLKTRVDNLLSDLKEYGWWTSDHSTFYLEYPESPDDLSNLAEYLTDSCEPGGQWS